MKNFVIIILIFSLLGVFNFSEVWAVGLSTTYNLTGDQDGELFGYPTRFIGDISNDGVSDFAIGSMGYDVGAIPDVGRVQIFSGASGAKIREHTQPFTSTASPSAFFGSAFAGIGDVNADGFGDYAIEDPRFSTGQGGFIADERGRVIAYSGQNGSVLWTYTGTTPFQFQFGNSLIISARDFNSDGKRDVAVGAPGINAILILNAANGSVITQYNGPEFTGASFDTGFDINNDGTEDFIVGDQYFTSVELFEGRVQVISGSDLANPSVIWTQNGPTGDRFAFFGIFTQMSSDTNNDGRPDFAVSSREDVSGLRNVGRLKVFSGLDNILLRQYAGTEQHELFGSSLANLGDVNNDGYADISLASLQSANGAGRADVYQSKAGIQWDKIPGGAAGEAQGSDIDGGVDVNSDSIPDLILGSTGGKVGPIDPGRARVVTSDPSHVPTGSNIEVHPEIGKQGTSITFPSVTTAGNITLTYLNQTSTGANFRTRQANKSEHWVITTNAIFSGDVTVCLKYDQATQAYNETLIDIQHFEGNSWSTKTTSKDAASDTVCGVVTTL